MSSGFGVGFERSHDLRYRMRYSREIGGAEQLRELLDRIEQQGFLIQQIEGLSGVEQTLADLEQHLLPWLVAERDEERFLRYALVAANLRGLAESVSREPALLRALARSGRLTLAADLAHRLPLTTERAPALAVLAACAREPAEVKRLGAGAQRSLEETVPPGDAEEADRWATSLGRVAEHLASECTADWPRWLSRLGAWPEVEARARRQIVTRWLTRGGAPEEGLWRLLEGARDLACWPTETLIALGRALATEREVGLARLQALPNGGPELYWPCALETLGALAEKSIEEALALWHERIRDVSAPWSPALVEHGAAFWVRLDDTELERQLEVLLSPAVVAVVRTQRAEGTADPADGDRALAVILALEGWELQRPLALRLCHRFRRSPEPWVLAILRQLGRHLEAQRYPAPRADLWRYLDTWAALEPASLRAHIDAVLGSPSGCPELLLELVARAQEPALLVDLFERAERWSALVAADGGAGFELRRQVVVRLACRLAERSPGLDVLEAARDRLLPEEEADLWVTAARALAATGRFSEAEAVADRLLSARQRLWLRLEILPEPPAELRSLPGLYPLVADTTAIEEERQALAALAELPADPQEIADRRLSSITDRRRQLLALVDLAQHTLAAHERAFPAARRDPLLAVAPLKQALGVIDSELWLARLSPEVAELGSELGPERCLVEYQEAIDQALGLTEVALRERLAILEALLVGLARQLERQSPEDHAGCLAWARRVEKLLDWLLRIPQEPALWRAVEPGWGEVLVLLTAWLERLPPWVRVARGAPRRARWAEGLLQISGRHSALALWRWIQAGSPGLEANGRQPLGSDALSLLSGPERQWLVSDAETRVHLADDLLASGRRDPEETRTAVYLLAAARPELALDLVRSLPGGEARDALCLRLVRHGWLPPGLGAELPGLSVPPESWQAALWHHFRNVADGATWFRRLVDLAGASAIDPREPSFTPIRRALWQIGRAESAGALARAVPEALANGGKQGGEACLQLWLNAVLAPRLGHEDRTRLTQGEAWGRAIEAAQRLPGTSPQDPARTAVSAPCRLETPEDLDRGLGVARGWHRASRAVPLLRFPPGSLSRSLGSMALLVAFGAGAVLIQLDGAFLPGARSEKGLSELVRTSLSIAALSWLVFGLFQGWLINRFVFVRREPSAGGRWRVLPLRLLAAVPMVGLVALPLLERVPIEEVRRSVPRLEPLSGKWAGSPPWRGPLSMRRLGSQWAGSLPRLVALFLTGFALTSVLAAGGSQPWPVSAALSALLHSAMLFGLGVFLWQQRRATPLAGWRWALLVPAAVLILLPVPFLPFLGLTGYFLASPELRENALGRAARKQCGTASRLELWQRLAERLREHRRGFEWHRRTVALLGEGDAPAGTSQELQVRRLYWIKASLLTVEAALLGTWLAGSARVPLTLVATVSVLIGLVAGLLTLIQLARAIAGVERSKLALIHHPRAAYLAWTQLALAGGVGIGFGVATQAPAQVAVVLIVGGLAGMLTLVLPSLLVIFLPVPKLFPSSELSKLMGVVLWGGAAAWGFQVGLAPGGGLAPFEGMLRAIALAGPLLVLTLLGALTHPWPLVAAWRRELPVRDRRALAFLVSTALLPLGGLAIPAWIELRRRHAARWREEGFRAGGRGSAGSAASPPGGRLRRPRSRPSP